MSLASVPGTPTDGSASPMDAYLLEVYRQAAEGARPSAGHRFSSIGAFLTFVGFVTAALALLFSLPEGESRPLVPAFCMTLGIIGFVVSLAFYALEVHRHRRSRPAPRFGAPTEAASSIYLASVGFFAFAVAIGMALLLLR